MNLVVPAEVVRLEQSGGDLERAIVLLQETVQRDPGCIDAYVHLAADSGILCRFEEAERYARKAVSLDRDSGPAKYYLACALRDQGRLDEAYKEIEEALVLVRKDAAKGTLGESMWEYMPLYGWNRNVEEAAVALRARMLAREAANAKNQIAWGLKALLGRMGIGPQKNPPGQSMTPLRSELKTYRNDAQGFEIDVPRRWGYPKQITVEDITWIPGPDEVFNIVIGPMIEGMEPAKIRFQFTQYCYARGFSEPTFGKIPLRGEDHIWARYQKQNRDWSKKYLIVLDGIEYAITASCVFAKDATEEIAAEKERGWDAIAASFRLVPHAEATGAQELPVLANRYFEIGNSHFEADRYRDALEQFEKGKLATRRLPGNYLGASMTRMQMIEKGLVPRDEIPAYLRQAEKDIDECIRMAPTQQDYTAAKRVIGQYKEKYGV